MRERLEQKQPVGPVEHQAEAGLAPVRSKAPTSCHRHLATSLCRARLHESLGQCFKGLEGSGAWGKALAKSSNPQEVLALTQAAADTDTGMSKP